MTLIEVKGDIGMATIVPDPDLIQGIFSKFESRGTPVLLIKNSGGPPVPADIMMRLCLVLGDS